MTEENVKNENDDLICPITLQLFRDPVRAKDGHVYERQAISKWIFEHGTSPLTREPLTLDDLQSDEHIKQLVKKRRNSTVSFNVETEQVILPYSIDRNRCRSRIYPCEIAHSTLSTNSSNRHRNKLFIGIFCCILIPISIIIATMFAIEKSSDDIQTSFRGRLTLNSSLYNRLNGSSIVECYYYNKIEMLISKDGLYKFTSRSSFDIYAYLYLSNFNSTNPNINLLISNDDDGNGNEFYFEYNLQSNSNKYILIITSFNNYTIGSYFIYIRGPMSVSIF